METSETGAKLAQIRRHDPLAVLCRQVRRVLAYGVVIDDGRLDAVIDMVVRLLLSHVVHPVGTPADTADDIAWISSRTLGV